MNRERAGDRRATSIRALDLYRSIGIGFQLPPPFAAFARFIAPMVLTGLTMFDVPPTAPVSDHPFGMAYTPSGGDC
ncbi:MAG: hypothetical protein ACO230_03455, partial [Ilumatobacteraceae bacterium]